MVATGNRRVSLVVALAAGVVAVSSHTALAQTRSVDFSEASEEVVYPLTFPVVGDTYYSDTFGACRDGCTRTHEGIDIMGYGWKGLPVVAAHAGTIIRTTESSGRDCCAIWGLRNDDGWESWYIHLNNDTPGTDDGLGWGFAPGIDVGVHVEAGDLIGWVGDSGNAEQVSPHLHFELHDNGTVVNPYESLRAATKVTLPRLAGRDRFDTAVEISQSAYPGGSDIAYIATGYNFPDALAGGPAAMKNDGPILLTYTDRLPAATAAELKRLAPSRVVILGGEEAVEPAVATTIAGLGMDLVRLAGRDRYDTAAMISAMHFSSGVETAYITGGLDFPAAVSGAPFAAANGGPMLLTKPDHLPTSTRDELARLNPGRIVIFGDETVVGADVANQLVAFSRSGTVERMAGTDDAQTAVAISQNWHPGGSSVAYLATNGTFVDALAGVSVAMRDQAPIFLVGDDLRRETEQELERLGASEIPILGGPEAVSLFVEMQVWSLLNHNDLPVWRS